MNLQFTVFIIDDDVGRAARAVALAAQRRLRRQAFESVQEFLAQHDPAVPGCVISDIAMPVIDGLQLQSALSATGVVRPIIFLTDAAISR